jgi:hypothetical protein
MMIEAAPIEQFLMIAPLDNLAVTERVNRLRQLG